MDYGRAFYIAARVYVWGLLLAGVATISVLFLPSGLPSPRLAGIWFALGGFGSLVLVTAILIYLLQNW
ncbi:MAG: hypothetical protein ACQEQJ_08545 [Halobacteriota archaeon]|uniref:hypothetical protein n=1 Tax=Halodesulfurarchaeum sp. HSR-GB TaxID=3074077 RepID=UPI002863094C|nr:hypothetical protein [Halodesulfurarchaeum sp. HSR-GB]MDR5657081.1 hypothetical protein [Halodesulfurarchaeum sp. HSR-GB]